MKRNPAALQDLVDRLDRAIRRRRNVIDFLIFEVVLGQNLPLKIRQAPKAISKAIQQISGLPFALHLQLMQLELIGDILVEPPAMTLLFPQKSTNFQRCETTGPRGEW
jgi:hypothetical protein